MLVTPVFGRRTDPVAAGAGTGGLAELVWTAQWWQWLLPFAAGTVGYLLSSALLLGTRHPVRWIAGAVLVLFLVDAVGTSAHVEWLANGPERLAAWLLARPGAGVASATEEVIPAMKSRKNHMIHKKKTNIDQNTPSTG